MRQWSDSMEANRIVWITGAEANRLGEFKSLGKENGRLQTLEQGHNKENTRNGKHTGLSACIL